MDPAESAALAAWAAAGVSLVSTGIGIWLTVRGRRDPHREALYEKQVEALIAVLSTLQDLMIANLEILIDPEVRMSEETFNKLQEITEKPRQAFNVEYGKYQWL